MSKYVLPELQYDHGALEPHISGKLLELHHRKHHAAYVKSANETIEQLAAIRERDDYSRLAALERALAFHLSGHVLHSIFWQNLAPPGGEPEPVGGLATAIERSFGGFDPFRRQLTHAASTMMGSGWGALMWDPIGERLVTTQIYDHQSNVTQGSLPLLVLDAWEHAYYLQYQNRKDDYFEAIWNLWNWPDVQRRFEAAQRVDLGIVRDRGEIPSRRAG